MAAPITQSGGPTESWGQMKKLGTVSETGTTGTTEPTASEPDRSGDTTGTTDPAGAGPIATEGAPAPSQPVASSAPVAAADQVTPMPDRLRDLIVEYSRNDAPALTDLHALAQRLQEREDWTAEIGLAPAAVRWATAEIVAQASASIRVQATQTQDGVRALLRLE